MAFGSYPSIRLAHAAARAQLLSGTDPMAERKAEKSAGLESKRRAEAEENGEVVNPFCEVAAQWFAKWKVGKVDRYAQNTEVRLKEDVLSRIGNRPIQAIASTLSSSSRRIHALCSPLPDFGSDPRNCARPKPYGRWKISLGISVAAPANCAGQNLTVERDPIFIKQGKFYTTAGVTSGIDLSLALVEE